MALPLKHSLLLFLILVFLRHRTSSPLAPESNSPTKFTDRSPTSLHHHRPSSTAGRAASPFIVHHHHLLANAITKLSPPLSSNSITAHQSQTPPASFHFRHSLLLSADQRRSTPFQITSRRLNLLFLRRSSIAAGFLHFSVTSDAFFPVAASSPLEASSCRRLPPSLQASSIIIPGLSSAAAAAVIAQPPGRTFCRFKSTEPVSFHPFSFF